jgi:hypothetical protein
MWLLKGDKFHASERSRITTINQFLEYGADPTIIDINGKTALHIFAEKSEWDNSSVYETSTILQAMIDSGAQLNQATPDGETIYSTVPTRSLVTRERAQENLMRKCVFCCRSQKSNFCRVATKFFLAVAIMSSIKLIFSDFSYQGEGRFKMDI